DPGGRVDRTASGIHAGTARRDRRTASRGGLPSPSLGIREGAIDRREGGRESSLVQRNSYQMRWLAAPATAKCGLVAAPYERRALQPNSNWGLGAERIELSTPRLKGEF